MSNPIDKAQQRIDELQQKLKQARALKSRIEARQRGGRKPSKSGQRKRDEKSSQERSRSR